MFCCAGKTRRLLTGGIFVVSFLLRAVVIKLLMNVKSFSRDLDSSVALVGWPEKGLEKFLKRNFNKIYPTGL